MAAGDAHLGVEAFNSLHEFRGGAGVQALLVADFEDPNDPPGGWGAIGDVGSVTHLPFSTRLAMVTYLRPASWAAWTASWSGHSSRTLASLTNIGKLMPASTST